LKAEIASWKDVVRSCSKKRDVENKEKNSSHVVNFTHILQAAFLPISFSKKLQTQTLSTERMPNNTFVQKKLLVKY